MGITIVDLKGPALAIDLEFKATSRIKSVFSKCGLYVGRCFGSKSRYRDANPGNQFVPNANVFCRTRGKIWWGDLDLANDKPSLEKAAKLLGLRLYVLSEFDGRFGNADSPHRVVIATALWHTGGRVRMPGLRSTMRDSGLSADDVALLLNMSKRRLLGLHDPGVAAKLRKRIDDMQSWIEMGLPGSWRGGWGRWLRRPNPTLEGVTPLEKLRRDKELSFGRTLLAEWPNGFGGKAE